MFAKLNLVKLASGVSDTLGDKWSPNPEVLGTHV